MATHIFTKSLSEFRINDDGSIDRMPAFGVAFVPWAAPGTKVLSLEVGSPMIIMEPDQIDPTDHSVIMDGRLGRTSHVLAVEEI